MRAALREAGRFALKLALALLGLVVATLVVVALALVMRTLVDLILDVYRTMRVVGQNPAKISGYVAVVLILLAALPLSIATGVSNVLYHRRERDLRESRPDDAVQPYEGPEGIGLEFNGPHGRLLLLRPPGGIGRPRRVEARHVDG